MTTLYGKVSRYAVWTSENSGDLFKANKISIDGVYVYFYLNGTLVKSYVATEFISNNPKLFESIKEQ